MNETFNNSKKIPLGNEEETYLMHILIYELSRQINIFATLAVISTGLIGNSIIIFVFMQSRFRTNSSNIFLLCLAIADSLYLILHFFEDTVRNYNDIYSTNNRPTSRFSFLMKFLNITNKTEFLCRSINYFRYCLRFVSAYIVVAITFQRLSLIYAPMSYKLRSKKTAWYIVLTIVIISLLINIWVSLLFTIQKNEDNKTYCDVLKAWHKEYFFITSIYITLVIVVPILTILISNSFIIYKTTKEEAKRKKLQQKRSKDVNSYNSVQLRDRYKSVLDVRIKRYYCNIESATNSKLY